MKKILCLIATLGSAGAERQMSGLAAMMKKSGYEVEVWDGDCSCQFDATKDIVTYNTTSESDAAAWALARAREGYHVTISYNERTGVYTCIGIK